MISTGDLVQVIIASFIAGLLDTVIGFGGGLLILPILAIIFSEYDAVILSALIPLGWNAVRVVMLRRIIELQSLGYFLVGIVPGLVIGTFMLERIDADALRVGIGILLIVLGLYHTVRLYVELPFPKLSERILFPCIGLLGGFLSALFGAGNGPLQSWSMAATGVVPAVASAVNGVLGMVTGGVRLLLYWWKGILIDVPWVAGVVGVAAAAVGGVVGVRMSRGTVDSTIRLVIGLAIVAAGLRMVF